MFRGSSTIKIITVIFLLIIASVVAPLDAGLDSEPMVTVHILSKQFRLLKAGQLKTITMSLMNESDVIGDGKRLMHGKIITFQALKGKVYASIDSQPLPGSGSLLISNSSGTGLVTVICGKENRRYPLPMTLVMENDDIHVYIRERLNQYVLDSALAEYSGEYWNEKEGILALAHVIRARYFFSQKVRQHRDSDFCDLTHCQVYRGRIDSNYTFDDAWVIDHSKLKHNLFFHSECGGVTLERSIFGIEEASPGSAVASVRDWLYREGIPLCSPKKERWERIIGNEELQHILFPRGKDNTVDAIDYDRKLMKIRIRSGLDVIVQPVETFRLKVNRIKGWNYLRSNNFTVTRTQAESGSLFVFKGSGLGHGVGLCQKGAIGLSRLGYSRYEIVEHYYPDVSLVNYAQETVSPYVSYCVFDIDSGKVLYSSNGPGFVKRRVPPGSIFKVIAALYLAAERPDIFNEYSYDCSGTNKNDSAMPYHCWKPKGHGTIRIRDALCNSCNLYFASLHKVVSEEKFRKFFRDFCTTLGIHAVMPAITGKDQWAQCIAGLDFRFSFTIGDMITLARYLHDQQSGEQYMIRKGVSVPDRGKDTIFAALQDTFIRGTAAGKLKPYGPSCNSRLIDTWTRKHASTEPDGMWGKTATVIDGTNKPMSYGLFLGGRGKRGIIVVLRKGNGALSARWARMILSRTETE